MPIHLSLPERALLRLGIIPAPLVDLAQHTTFRLLLAGYRLGVFDALADGPLPLDQLSRRLQANPASLEPFLDALRLLGYISLRHDRYANTPAAARWLITASPHSLAGIVPFLEDHLRRWEYLEETIKAGQPPRNAYDFYRAHPDRWPSFHDGQRAIASFSAAEVARKARLPAGPLRLLDAGGSHALYTIALCRRYPDLHAVIYDWPQGVDAAQRSLAAAGPAVAARIGTHTGDFLTDDLGGGYDVVLLGNILHGQRPAPAQALLRRLRATLTEHGTLLIVDQVRMRQPLARLGGYVARAMGIFLLNELGGGIYPYATLRAWLHDAGFRDVRLRRLLHAPGFVLIQATVRELSN